MPLNTAYKNPVIEELKKTEQSYNASLKLLVQAFDKNPPHNPYLIQMSNVIRQLDADSDDFLSIFDKLYPHAIKKTSARKNLLELPADTEIELEQVDPTKKLIQFQYESFGRFLEHYRTYAPLFVRYQHEFMDDPDSFTRIDAWLRTNNPKALGLGDHISTPFQRGPRYRMLLDALIKKPDHIDPALLETFKLLQQGCGSDLNAINDLLPNFQEEYTEHLARLDKFKEGLVLKNRSKPSKSCERLITAIENLVKELDRDDFSQITRNDILCQTNDMLLEIDPTRRNNKIINYRETASTLPGKTMSNGKRCGLGFAMLALATAVAATVILVTGAPLSAAVVGSAALGVVLFTGATTFFGSRRQTGLAQATSQLVNNFEGYLLSP